MKVKAVVLLLFLAVLAGCSYFSRKAIEKPKVAVQRVNMRDYNVEGATLVFVLNVMNPNSFPLKVDGLKYNIELDGKQLIDGKLEQAANLAANSETSIDVPIPVRFDQLFSSALDFALKGKSPYRIRGEAKFGLFNIPFDESGELSIKR